MAYDTIYFENPHTGEMRNAPVGFSWTTMFFGFFPPLFRSDWKWAIIMFLLFAVTFGVSSFVFPFFYNRLYIRDLINRGFVAKATEKGSDLDWLSRKVGIRMPIG